MSKSYSNNTGYTNLYFWPRWSGKTQQAVIDAYEAHQRGEIIISNIWLNFPHMRFTNIRELVPILREIAAYNHHVVTPAEAPIQMLHQYGMERKRVVKLNKFFILIDEIGKHLNSRNWQKNFKDEMLVDMLTEPRKYNMTIIGIAQAWSRVDVQFRQMTEDWFLFRKTGGWIFERMYCSQLWIHNWEFSMDNPIVIRRTTRWVFFMKIMEFFRTLYYTKEIIWAGQFWGNVPSLFRPWSIFPLTSEAIEEGEKPDEAPQGVEADAENKSPESSIV